MVQRYKHVVISHSNFFALKRVGTEIGLGITDSLNDVVSEVLKTYEKAVQAGVSAKISQPVTAELSNGGDSNG